MAAPKRSTKKPAKKPKVHKAKPVALPAVLPPAPPPAPRVSIEGLADYILLHPELSETACVVACGWAEGSVSKVLAKVRPIVAARKKKNSEQVDKNIVKRQTLDLEFLDQNLRDVIEHEEGMARVQGIKLGYGRLGISVDPDSAPPAPPTFPAMYNYLFQQKMQNAQGDTVTNTVAVEGKTPLELPAAPVLQSRPRDRNDEILVEIEGELRD